MSDTAAVKGVDILRALMAKHDPTTEQYGQGLLRAAVAANDTLQIFRIYVILGRFYTNALGNVAKSYEYADLAERLAAEYKISAECKAEMCFMISGTCKAAQDYRKAIQYAEEGLNYLQSAPDAPRQLFMEGYLSLGMLQLILGLKELAIGNVQKALEYSDDIKDVIRCKMTIAKSLVISRPAEALKIYKEIEPHEQLLGNEDNRAIFRDYMGNVYLSMGEYDQAIPYLLQSLEIRRRGLQPVKKIHPLYDLCIIYFRTGRKEEGAAAMQEIFDLVQKYPGYLTDRVRNYLYQELYAESGDYQHAHHYWKQLDHGSVDQGILEQTLKAMIESEQHKQEMLREQANSLATLNEDMQSHMRQLESMNTDLQSYARTASHDLREPLRMISTYMTILSQKLNDKLSDDEQKFMHFAVDGARRMDDMITRILSAAKSQDVALRPVDLSRIAAQAGQNLSRLAQEKNAVLTHDPLPLVMGDDIQLLQVIQNIVTNAIKYNASRQPVVHLSFLKADGKCILSIADNGVGIPESERENVFKMYQRIENSTGEDGTGIGLATVKRNIERMKGRIWIEGNEPNGCIFKIELPLAI
ncbi:MAG: tetratricopeptide repeat protein [Bacteroidetes bacterium]|nr:tetratricopeptide repeat protein [Bacteroidota bacterium]